MPAPEWSEAFAGTLAPGDKPALLLVDPVMAYVKKGSPLYLQSGQGAVDEMAKLLDAFRKAGLPVVFTNVKYEEGGADGGYFFKKVPALQLFVGNGPAGRFPPELQPRDGEAVLTKQYPSAFFDTGLSDMLHDRGVDTVFVAGFSTSGCVRASTLDALQSRFIPIVVVDACADRPGGPHENNLHDLKAKYAELATTDEAVAYVTQGATA